jgi:hypothetical protein
MKKVMLTVPWGQFDPTVIIVSGNVSVCSRNWRNQIQNSLGWDWHLHLFHCRYLTLHWTRGRFHPSSNYLQYRPHVHYRRHLTHLSTPERRCTTIPVVLPLCYAPHVTEPHKRKILYYMEGTMGSICPQAEINTNKKWTERHKKLADVCDIVRKALRKNT